MTPLGGGDNASQTLGTRHQPDDIGPLRFHRISATVKWSLRSMQLIDAKSLTEKQRLALISLLADDDPAVYNLIRSKLLAYGSDAEEWLQSELLSSNPTMRRRARDIILHHAGTCPRRIYQLLLSTG